MKGNNATIYEIVNQVKLMDHVMYFQKREREKIKHIFCTFRDKHRNKAKKKKKKK
jgi:hypothetical protein